MQNKFDYAVFIGRFQPLHEEHIRVINKGLEYAEKIILLIGSSNCPRNIRNPFTFDERKIMIGDVFKFDPRIIIRPLPDYTYNNTKWIEGVRNTVASITKDADVSVALLGCHKDGGTSYYLKMFPEWNSINIPLVNEISATGLRKILFDKMYENSATEGGLLKYDEVHSEFNTVVWHGIVDIVQHMETDFMTLLTEYKMIEAYKKQWESAPYAPTFVTVDAMVVQSGHILLVKRGAMPGRGQWALPGGFINQDERIEEAILRELEEETKIKVPDKVLLGNMKHIRVFDDPNRSSRGRTITHCGLIQLPDDVRLPKVKGSDDASKASWWKLNEVRENFMYEDHYHIISYMKGFLKN